MRGSNASPAPFLPLSPPFRPPLSLSPSLSSLLPASPPLSLSLLLSPPSHPFSLPPSAIPPHTHTGILAQSSLLSVWRSGSTQATHRADTSAFVTRVQPTNQTPVSPPHSSNPPPPRHPSAAPPTNQHPSPPPRPKVKRHRPFILGIIPVTRQQQHPPRMAPAATSPTHHAPLHRRSRGGRGSSRTGGREVQGHFSSLRKLSTQGRELPRTRGVAARSTGPRHATGPRDKSGGAQVAPLSARYFHRAESISCTRFARASVECAGAAFFSFAG